jgi:hypothetical protein
MGRLRLADVIAGIGGVVLLGSLFLKWYGFDASGLVPEPLRSGVIQELNSFSTPSATAWQIFSITDILLAAVALLAMAIPVVTAVATTPAKPVALTVVTSVAGAFAVLLVLYRIVNQPGDNALIAVKAGAWIGLAGALISFAGAWLAMADEHTPGAVPPPVPRRPAPPSAI